MSSKAIAQIIAGIFTAICGGAIAIDGKTLLSILVLLLGVSIVVLALYRGPEPPIED